MLTSENKTISVPFHIHHQIWNDLPNVKNISSNLDCSLYSVKAMLVEVRVGVAINPGDMYSLEITNLSTYYNRRQELMTRKAFNHVQRNSRVISLASCNMSWESYLCHASKSLSLHVSTLRATFAMLLSHSYYMYCALPLPCF